MELSIWRIYASILTLVSIAAASKSKNPAIGEPHNHTDMDAWNCFKTMDGAHSEVLESCIDFDPFEDLESDKYEDNYPGDLTYFEFTDANINASRAIEWYKEFSIKYQETSFWKQHGEWSTFAAVFTHNTNLACTISSPDCTGIPELESLHAKFPHKPALTRRIYFILEMYKKYHSVTYHKLDAFKTMYGWLVWKIAEVVTTAQQQKDLQAEELCQLLHWIINTATDIAISIAAEVTQGIADKYLEDMPGLSAKIWELATGPEKKPSVEEGAKQGAKVATQIVTQLGTNAGKKAEKKTKPWSETIADYAGMFDIAGLSNCNKVGRDCFYTANKIQKYLLSPVWTGQDDSMNEYVKALLQGSSGGWGGYGTLPGLEGGAGTDPLCASFGGGMTIDVEANVDEVRKIVIDKTEEIGHIIVRDFEMLYDGQVVAPGNISITSFVFANQQWEGVGSIVADMKEANRWLEDLKLQMVMQMASLAASRDHSYAKCTHSKEAGNMCAKAATAEPCSKHDKNCYRGVFCPKPTTDPELVCRAAKWWPSVEGGNEVALPSLEKWEGFMDDKFKLTRQKILQSIWLWYEEFGNRDDAFQIEWGSKDSNVTNLAGGFHVPVCYRPGMDIMDEKFPTTCGKDWRATETIDFMKMLNVDAESTMYNDKVFNAPNALFRGFWPKYVHENSATMVAQFNNLCDLNIRFGNKNLDRHPNIIDENYRIHLEKDPSCDIVQETIADMDLIEATEWFCRQGADVHGVFDHELPYIILWRMGPREIIRNHGHHCKKWRKKYPAPFEIGGNYTVPDDGDFDDTNSTFIEG